MYSTPHIISEMIRHASVSASLGWQSMSYRTKGLKLDKTESKLCYTLGLLQFEVYVWYLFENSMHKWLLLSILHTACGWGRAATCLAAKIIAYTVFAPIILINGRILQSTLLPSHTFPANDRHYCWEAITILIAFLFRHRILVTFDDYIRPIIPSVSKLDIPTKPRPSPSYNPTRITREPSPSLSPKQQTITPWQYIANQQEVTPATPPPVFPELAAFASLQEDTEILKEQLRISALGYRTQTTLGVRSQISPSKVFSKSSSCNLTKIRPNYFNSEYIRHIKDVECLRKRQIEAAIWKDHLWQTQRFDAALVADAGAIGAPLSSDSGEKSVTCVTTFTKPETFGLDAPSKTVTGETASAADLQPTPLAITIIIAAQETSITQSEVEPVQQQLPRVEVGPLNFLDTSIPSNGDLALTVQYSCNGVESSLAVVDEVPSFLPQLPLLDTVSTATNAPLLSEQDQNQVHVPITRLEGSNAMTVETNVSCNATVEATTLATTIFLNEVNSPLIPCGAADLQVTDGTGSMSQGIFLPEEPEFSLPEQSQTILPTATVVDEYSQSSQLATFDEPMSIHVVDSHHPQSGTLNITATEISQPGDLFSIGFPDFEMVSPPVPDVVASASSRESATDANEHSSLLALAEIAVSLENQPSQTTCLSKVDLPQTTSVPSMNPNFYFAPSSSAIPTTSDIGSVISNAPSQKDTFTFAISDALRMTAAPTPAIPISFDFTSSQLNRMLGTVESAHQSTPSKNVPCSIDGPLPPKSNVDAPKSTPSPQLGTSGSAFTGSSTPIIPCTLAPQKPSPTPADQTKLPFALVPKTNLVVPPSPPKSLFDDAPAVDTRRPAGCPESKGPVILRGKHASPPKAKTERDVTTSTNWKMPTSFEITFPTPALSPNVTAPPSKDSIIEMNDRIWAKRFGHYVPSQVPSQPSRFTGPIVLQADKTSMIMPMVTDKKPVATSLAAPAQSRAVQILGQKKSLCRPVDLDPLADSNSNDGGASAVKGMIVVDDEDKENLGDTTPPTRAEGVGRILFKSNKPGPSIAAGNDTRRQELKKRGMIMVDSDEDE